MVTVVGKNENVAKRITCRHCGSILEYYPREVKSVHGTDYGGGPDGREYIDCPTCQDTVTIRSW